ncbi:hypothetical protein CEQ90_13650 [Lewinellaceae bacterium SD302]|nr:hypothetical protein CEQ90_13650 [Lewinellaceae bacterium SD302]
MLAQRSIYDDVQLLRQIESTPNPTVTFKFQQPDSITLDARIMTTRADLPIDKKEPIPLVYQGYLSLYFENVSWGDSIIFTFPDTTLRLAYPAGIDTSDMDISELEEDGMGWYFNLGLLEDEIRVSGSDEDLYEHSFESVERKVEQAEIALFGTEIVRRLRSRQYQLKEDEVERPLRSNPFLSPIVYGNRSRKQVDYYAPVWNAADAPKTFLDDYYQTYPYQRFIDGDSLLDFRRNLALTTTSSSYRNQIVTAQNELQAASATVDANRKKSGGFSAQAVAVGLSDFIAERAQEELNLTFFHRFKENLAKESELTVLFPATRDLMFKFEISNYKTFLNFARETFQNDLDNLSLNIPGILDLKKYQKLKDDPNVFNLSLIYNVADLAYRNVEVENILLSSLQQLQQRRDFLNQSINLAITDSILKAETLEASPLADYRQNLTRYLSDVQEASQYMLDVTGRLGERFEKELEEWDQRDRGNWSVARIDVSRKMNLNEFQPRNTSYELKQSMVEMNVYPPIGQVVNLDVDTDSTVIDFTKNYLEAKLAGRDYHLFRLDRDQPEDFENYYLQEPIPAEENILVGLDASRELLDQAYDNKFERSLQLINKGLDDYQVLKTENQRVGGLTSQIVFERAENAFKRLFNFQDLIQQEVTFWKEVSAQDEQNHYIGGLVFLRNQFDNRFYELDPSLLSGYREVTASHETYPKESVEYREFNLYALDSAKLAAANQRILSMNDVIDEYFEKFRNQQKRVATAFSPRFNELAPPYSGFGAQDSSSSTPIQMPIGEQYAKLQYELQPIVYDAGLSLTVSDMDEAFLEDEEMNDFRDIELQGAIYRTQKLHRQRDSLQQQLAKLEKTYAGKLVDARQNAADMSTIFSMASQLTFALRTYDKEEDKLYYQDTQRVEIVRELPGGQMTKDSLLIDTLAVPGTDDESKSRWITRQEFDALRKDEQAWNLYLGLIYQRLSSVGEGEQFSPEGVALLTTKFFDLINDIDEQRNNFRRKKAANPKSITFQDYYPFIRSSVDLFNTVITTPLYRSNQPTFTSTGTNGSEKFVTATPEGKETKDKKVGKSRSKQLLSTTDPNRLKSLGTRSTTLAMVPLISNEALSLYENIFVKNYGNAVLNATELLKILTGQPSNQLARLSPPLKEQAKTSSQRPSEDNEAKSQEMARLTRQERKAKISNTRGINAVFRYGALMASMIDARTSDQVRNILRATTLPPGSSRIKREVVSNVTINSYLGAGLGRDRLLDAPMDIDADAFGAALSVPIGITYSFSPAFLRNSSSFSVHIPLLDLGAITAYRSNPGGNTANVNNLPELEWRNLFSPGAYFIYNFADSPFSLGLGGQYGPQLREVVPENGEPIFLNSWRFPMVMFTIDVPFYNLHTGTRKIVVR